MKRSYGKAFKGPSQGGVRKKKKTSEKVRQEEADAFYFKPNPKGALTTGNISGGTLALPSSAKATLRYVHASTLDPGTGGVSLKSFRANGLYDPEVAVGGHQPRGFDQFTPFYTHYHVIGSVCTVYWANTGTTANQIAAGVFLNDVSSPGIGSTPIDYLEASNNAWKVTCGGSGADTSMSVKQTFSASKFFGVKSLLSSEDHGAAVTLDPVDQAYFHVWMGQPQGDADVPAQAITVVIDYVVVFHGRADLSAS